jgi:hypothetical protein
MSTGLLFTWGDPNTDTLLATTTSAWLATEAVDQFFNQTAFLSEMNKHKKMQDGGASILVPLMTDENSTATNYENYDILDVTPQEGFVNTQAQWKNTAVSVSISGPEGRQNSGRNKMISMLESKLQQAALSMSRKMTADLFASATVSKGPTTIVEMIDATSTIQDINSTNFSYWQGDVNASGSFAAQGLSDMRTLWTDISQRTPSTLPDMLPTTSTIYNYYEGSLQPQTRYSPGGQLEGSFESLKFKTANIFYDSQATSGVLYMFPSQNLFLVVNSHADMKRTEFVKPSNQDAKTAQILMMYQFVTNSRRKCGKLTGITA